MKKARILVVEDESIVSMDLQSLLEDLGYDASITANTGADAIEKAGTMKPDLVLMDVALSGGMDGIEAAKIIRDMYDIPVIYLTGNADIDMVHRARATEPYGYVMKPISMLDLFSNIDTALRRHDLQEKLKESENRFRSLVEFTSDWVWEIDQNDNYVYTNPKVKEILGYEPYEVIGKNILFFAPRDEVRRIRREAIDIRDSRRPFYVLRNINIHKDGRRVYLETSGVPFFDENGNYKGYRGIDRDVTERTQAEMALRESENRYRSLVESSSDLIWELDKNWCITYASPRVKDMLEYESGEVIGRSVLSFVPQEVQDRISDIMKDFIQLQKSFNNMEIIILHKNGSRVVLETSGVPFFDENGNFNGFRCINRDITKRKNDEIALRENEERFRALVQNLQDIVVIIDSKGMIKFENPATKALLGYSIVGRNFIEMLHPDDIATAIHDFGEVVTKTNPHVPTTVRIRHADASWVYIEVLATNLFDNTTIQGGLFVCRDVTARMKAQTALRESEERYRALFNQSPVGVMLFNPSLIVTDCSERLAAIMLATREKIIGMDLGRTLESELVSKFRETIGGNISSYEGPFKSENDNLYLYITLEASPLRNADGNVVGGIAAIQDMTEKKIAEARLVASEERTRLVVENATEGIIIIRDGRLSFTNGKFKEMLAYSNEELASNEFIHFIHPDDRESVVAYMERHPDGGGAPAVCEARLLGKNNTVTWIDINKVLFNWEGAPALLCFLRDITMRKWADEERKNIEAQIQQTQKLESLGVLAGGIAHDFNNLLMAVLGNLDLSLLDASLGTASRGYLLEAVKASQRAADLCRQMLAYSGRGQFINEALNLTDLINDMRHMLEVSVSKKALLRFDLSPELPSIEADATQIRQIIMNLVINASDAIDEKSGVITIATGAIECDNSYLSGTWLNQKLPEGLYVFLEVIDTGCGMDGETLRKIFDPFFTTKFTGRGLGLAAVLGIVRGHRGAIMVHSVKNRGTTFRILLPAAEAPAEPLRTGDEADVAWRGKGTVLFADDEETIRTLGKKMLERWGFDVLLAADGSEAVDVYRKNADEIVCIVLDLTMPRMDGEETFLALLKIKSDVRVIISSGYNEQEINKRFAGKKLAGFIQKPYQMAELSLKLKQILG